MTSPSEMCAIHHVVSRLLDLRCDSCDILDSNKMSDTLTWTILLVSLFNQSLLVTKGQLLYYRIYIYIFYSDSQVQLYSLKQSRPYLIKKQANRVFDNVEQFPFTEHFANSNFDYWYHYLL